MGRCYYCKIGEVLQLLGWGGVTTVGWRVYGVTTVGVRCYNWGGEVLQCGVEVYQL